MLDMCLSLFVGDVVGLALGLGALTGSKYIFVYALQRGTAVSVGCVYWLGRHRWCHVGVVMYCSFYLGVSLDLLDGSLSFEGSRTCAFFYKCI